MSQKKKKKIAAKSCLRETQTHPQRQRITKRTADRSCIHLSNLQRPKTNAQAKKCISTHQPFPSTQPTSSPNTQFLPQKRFSDLATRTYPQSFNAIWHLLHPQQISKQQIFQSREKNAQGCLLCHNFFFSSCMILNTHQFLSKLAKELWIVEKKATLILTVFLIVIILLIIHPFICSRHEGMF